MIDRIARSLGIGQHARPARRHPLQLGGTQAGHDLLYLGTDYGGWKILNDPALHGATIISAGLGEDASFDIEFLNRFNAKAIVVDPTPRAVAHHAEIIASLGAPRTRDYVDGGLQAVASYDLAGITADRLVLDPRALWNTETTVKFFQPANPAHVSHSILNYQHVYRDDTAHIEVPAVPLSRILSDHALDADSLHLVKFDIEGAEIEVIIQMLADGIRPRQVCVEYDELNRPTRRAYARVDSAHDALTSAGYHCVHTDGSADFLYLRQE